MSERQAVAAHIKSRLQAMKDEAFIESYAKSATDEETVGLLLATLFEWDGLAILYATRSALEDANFHAEAAKVEEMADDVRKDTV